MNKFFKMIWLGITRDRISEAFEEGYRLGKKHGLEQAKFKNQSDYIKSLLKNDQA